MRTRAALAAALLTAALAHAEGPPERAPGGMKQGHAAPGPPRQDQPDSRRQRVLQSLLYGSLTVSFERPPAREAVDFIGTALGVNLAAHYSGDNAGGGIDPDLPITLEARGAPAVEVLDDVLEQCSAVEECTWQVRRGLLEVGTKERLSVSAAREIRWYPVDELTFEAPNFTDAVNLRLDNAYPFSGTWGYGNTWPGGGGYGGSIQLQPAQVSGGSASQRGDSLIDLIVTVVEPTAWTRNGGDRASIVYRDGVLIVNAPDYIQRKIFGYPRVPPPPKTQEEAGATPAAPQP